MRILINALSAKLGGGQTCLKNLLQHIPADFEGEIFFLCGEFNRSEFERFKHDKVRFLVETRYLKNPVLRCFWEFFFLYRLLKRNRIDLLFQPTPDCFCRIPAECHSVTMFRNMLPFDKAALKLFPLFCMTKVRCFILKLLNLRTIHQFEHVIFISEYSRDAICKRIPAVKEKSSVIRHGLDEAFFATPSEFDLSKYNLQSGQFYLYVSNPDYYKLQIELLSEWKRLKDCGFRYPLVLTGSMRRKRYVKRLVREIKRLNLEDSVLITGPLSHEDIPSMLISARALVFASVCECCPNILLEKMASGKAVFCSNYAPMPEFGGTAPVYFDPFSSADLSGKILAAEADSNKMSDCARACKLQSEQFNVTDSATRIFACMLNGR